MGNGKVKGGGIFGIGWGILAVVFMAGVPVGGVWAKVSCEKVVFDRQSWGFNSATHRVRMLAGKGQSRGGRTFKDEYTGQVLALNVVGKAGKKLANAHVDHVVPLKYMHDNGGCRWSVQKKRRFANDPKNLKLISAYANTSKGSKNPSQWLPSTKRAQIRYLRYWNEVMNEYSASKLKMKMFKFGDPKFVKYARVAGKFGRVGVRFIPAIGTVATLVTTADTVIVISQDPDKYFEELAMDFQATKETSFEWSSASWDTTKKWSLASWEDAANWELERNSGSLKWTVQIWDRVKQEVGQLGKGSLDGYNKRVEKLRDYGERHIVRDKWEVVKQTTNKVVKGLIGESLNLYRKGVDKLDQYINESF